MRRHTTVKALGCLFGAVAVNGAAAGPVQVDPTHPPQIGAAYYPPESVRLHEEGICNVKVLVAADGTVHDISLTLSTGYAHLDAACLNAFASGGLLPATEEGKPIDKVVEIPIRWNLPPEKHSPKVNPNNPPHIGEAYYPRESERRGEQGRCKVSVTVTADGKTRDIKLTASTGYPRLDQACLEALAHDSLLPATEDGKPIDMTLEIPIVWILKK